MSALVLFVLLTAQASVREQMQEGIRLVQAGQPARAREIFEAIIDEIPQHGPARLQLGQLAATRGDWAEAERHLEVAVRSDPRRPQLAWFLLGRTRAALVDQAAALVAIEHALEIAPDFLPARTYLAEVALDQGNLWSALSHYREAARQYPGRADVQGALANVARRMQADDLARCAADAALAAEPGTGALHYLRAVIAENEGDVEQAMKSCRRALELGFDNAAVHITLGNLYHEKMMLAESIAAFEKGLELDPAAAESLASFALASLTTGEYTALRPLLELHAVEHPGKVNTLYALGSMHLREGKLDKAEIAFEQVTRLAPESSEAHYNLAMTYTRQGRRDEGRVAMDRFRELKAREDDAWQRGNARAKLLQRMTEAHDSEDHAGVVALGLSLAREGAMKADELLTVANSLRKLEREVEATELVTRALEENPYHRETLVMADALGDASAGTLLALLDANWPDCQR